MLKATIGGRSFARILDQHVAARTATLSRELAEVVDAETRLLNQRGSTFEKAEIEVKRTKEGLILLT